MIAGGAPSPTAIRVENSRKRTVSDESERGQRVRFLVFDFVAPSFDFGPWLASAFKAWLGRHAGQLAAAGRRHVG